MSDQRQGPGSQPRNATLNSDDAARKQTSHRKYLRRQQAAQYLQEQGIPRTAKTLAKLASIGGGPVFQLFGRIPLYTTEDLDDYVVSKMGKPVRSTSEHGAA